jgi:hypothetical protein
MCDNDSNYPEIGLYDIPEFLGYDPLQDCSGGEPSLQASIEKAKPDSSETRTDSEDEVSFTLSKPALAPPRPDISIVDNTAHNIQVVSQHVIIFDQQNPPEIPRASPQILAPPSPSAHIVTKETSAHREQRLLREIIANPRRRKERATALTQLQRQAAKLDLASAQAPLRISELHKLTQRLASQTENTASELFARYLRQARKRYSKSIVNAKGGSEVSKNILQSLSVNLGSAQGSRTLPTEDVLIIEVKPLLHRASAVQDTLQNLHHTVNSGATIPEARYATVRQQVMQLAQTLGFDQEVELAKFDFLYNRRSCIIQYFQHTRWKNSNHFYPLDAAPHRDFQYELQCSHWGHRRSTR